MNDPTTWAAAGREAWMRGGEALVAARSERAWELADWAVAGAAAFGDAALRETAEGLGLGASTVRNCLRTARSFPVHRRRAGLPFSYHQDVAHLPDAEAERLLDAASIGVWSRSALREAAREATLAARLRRAEDEITRLREENERLRTDAQTARGEARRLEHGVAAASKAVVAAYRDIAAQIEAFGAGTACAALHGNARPALRQRIEQLLARAGGRAARVVEDRIVPALDRIDRGGA